MKLHAHRYYFGPNVHARHPGLALHLEPEAADTFWNWQPSIVEAAALLDDLRSLFPAMVDAAAPDDAVRIAQAATPAAELILSVVAGLVRDYCADPARGRLLDDRASGAGRIVLFLPCEEIGIAVNAWALASRVPEIFHAAPQPDGQQRAMAALRDAYWTFRGQCLQLGLNQSNIALARAAVARGIPHYRLVGRTQQSQFGQGRHRQRIFETLTEKTGGVARHLVRDKLITGSLLAASGVPTPGSRAAATEQEAIKLAREFGGLVVVKPRNSGKGKGVSVRLRSDAEIGTAFRGASQHGAVIVERFVEGDEHRMLVVAGRLVGVGQRQPGAVVGDGVRTVRELVEELNRDPRRGLPFERPLEWLKFDEEARRLLAAQDLTETSIPARDRAVKLRGASNLSRGGNALDLTAVTHPDNRALMERIARILGLDVVGLDFLTPDVRRSWREVPCAVLEANTTPGLGPHMTLDGGRGVSDAIVAHLFPGQIDGRIPSVAVTGGARRTAVSRLIAHLLARSGSTVALSSAQGAHVGDELIHRGEAAMAPATLAALLHDPGVDAAVFECPPASIAQRGLFLDVCDVGVVLPADAGDDTGIPPFEAVTDVVAANSRRWVVRDGARHGATLPEGHLDGVRLCLVGATSDAAGFAAHRATGGRCVYRDDSSAKPWIVVEENGATIARIGPVAEKHDIDALFACAAALALRIEASVIERGLAEFQTLP